MRRAGAGAGGASAGACSRRQARTDLRRRSGVAAWRRRCGIATTLVGGSGCGSGLFAVPAAFGLPRRLARPRLARRAAAARTRRLARGGAVVDGEDHRADLHLVALLDLDLFDDAGHRRRHFDCRLVGLELQDRLVLLDRVADVDEHARDVAAGDVLPQFGNLELRHVSP